jgi:hypothetical protein
VGRKTIKGGKQVRRLALVEMIKVTRGFSCRANGLFGKASAGIRLQKSLSQSISKW